MTFTLHYTDNGKQLELWRYWKSCKLGNYIKKQNKPKQKKPKSIIYLSVAKVITVATISRFPGKISVFQNKMELKQSKK